MIVGRGLNDGMVDMTDLKSVGHCVRVGSNPISATRFIWNPNSLMRVCGVQEHLTERR